MPRPGPIDSPEGAAELAVWPIWPHGPSSIDPPEGAAELTPPDDMVVLLDPPEAMPAAELFGLLPAAARQALVAGLSGTGR